MSNLPKLPSWSECFDNILSLDRRALEWGLPETWVHAELYADLMSKKEVTGGEPLPTEIPYVTLFPVMPGRGVNARPDGIVKWSDLCLHTEDFSSWCWIELKVRHVGEPEAAPLAAKRARDGFRKDVVALQGFIPAKTETIWACPNDSAFYYSKRLIQLANHIHCAKHHFVAILIQLNGKLDETIWAEKAVSDEINKWRTYRLRAVGDASSLANQTLPQSVRHPVHGHEILLYEWSL